MALLVEEGDLVSEDNELAMPALAGEPMCNKVAEVKAKGEIGTTFPLSSRSTIRRPAQKLSMQIWMAETILLEFRTMLMEPEKHLTMGIL